MEKQCFKCGETKPLSAFYKHKMMADGHVNKCKECNKRDVRENRAAKLDYYREYDRSRANNPDRVEARAEYQKTDSCRAAKERSGKKWIENNAIKKAASIIVCNAVRDKRLIKSYKCSKCGSSGRIHGHHDDYAFPLVVRWLCSKCHAKWHKENGPGANG